MRRLFAALIVALSALVGCGGTGGSDDARFSEQADAFDQQTDRVNQMIDAQDAQVDRYNKLLDKMEEQLRRQDAILDANEKRLGIKPAKP